MAKFQVIINGDDFAYSSQRNEGIMKCIKKGRVTSTSVLVNGTSLREIDTLKLLQTQGLNFSIGLHFNITEGVPLLNNETIPSLVNSKGYFWGKFGIHKALKDNLINPKHVTMELKAQIEKFRGLFCTNPVHVDGHNHIHIFPLVRNVFAKVLAEERLYITRLPNEIFPSNFLGANIDFYQTIVKECKNAQLIFNENNIKWPTSFVGMSTMGRNMSTDNLSLSFSRIKAQPRQSENIICEIMTHPGLRGLKDHGGCGIDLDDFELSDDRQFECEFLCSEEFGTFLTWHNVVLKTYEDCKILM